MRDEQIPEFIIERKLPRALAELRSEPIWMPFKLVRGRNGKHGKIPRDWRTGGVAYWGKDPSCRVTWGTACRAVERFRLHGVGLVLADGLGAIDLDDCRDPDTRMVDVEALAILKRARACGLYTEISVSGTGYHVLGAAKGSPLNRKVGSFEAYRCCNRFITISGRQVGDATRLVSIDGLIEDLLDRFAPGWDEAPSSTGGCGKPVEVDPHRHDWRDVLRRYRLVGELYDAIVRPASSMPGRRSDLIYKIAATLIEAGATDDEVGACLWACRCFQSKYPGDYDALDREIARIGAKVG